MRACCGSMRARPVSASSRATRSIDVSALNRQRLIQGDANLRAPSFGGAARTSALDENLAHRQGRDGKEVRAVLPVLFLVFQQSQVRFVNQRSGLKCLSGSLAPQIAASQPPELVVHDRHDFRDGLLVSGGGPVEDAGYGGR